MILLTGGAGHIGSHVSVALLDAGLDVVAVDNLSNSNEASLERVQTVCGRSLVFRHADICNEEEIYEILRAYEVNAVIHLAGKTRTGARNESWHGRSCSGKQREQLHSKERRCPAQQT